MTQIPISASARTFSAIRHSNNCEKCLGACCSKIEGFVPEMAPLAWHRRNHQMMASGSLTRNERKILERVAFARRAGMPEPDFFVSGAISIDGPFDSDRFASAVRHVLAENALLLVDYQIEGGTILRIGPYHPPEDALELRLASGAGAMMRIVREARMRLPAVGGGRLFKLVLIRRGPTRHVFLAFFHHAIVDGWSFALFAARIKRWYEADAEVNAGAAKPRLGSIDYLDRQARTEAAFDVSEQARGVLREIALSLRDDASLLTMPTWDAPLKPPAYSLTLSVPVGYNLDIARLNALALALIGWIEGRRRIAFSQANRGRNAETRDKVGFLSEDFLIALNLDKTNTLNDLVRAHRAGVRISAVQKRFDTPAILAEIGASKNQQIGRVHLNPLWIHTLVSSFGEANVRPIRLERFMAIAELHAVTLLIDPGRGGILLDVAKERGPRWSKKNVRLAFFHLCRMLIDEHLTLGDCEKRIAGEIGV